MTAGAPHKWDQIIAACKPPQRRFVTVT